MIMIILMFLFLLLASSFFSASETALTGVSKNRLAQQSREGNRRAILVQKLRGRTEEMMTTLLLGNTLMNTLSSALATAVFLKLFGERGLLYATGITTILVLIFAEVLPKTLALYHADRVALFLAPAVNFWMNVFSPITRLVEKIVRFIVSQFVDGAQVLHHFSEEELLGAIHLHGVRGEEEEKKEVKMLRSILDLDGVEVGEIMVHRKNIMMLDADLPIEMVFDEIAKAPHTRIPVWSEDPDNIIGVLNVKNLWRTLKLQGKNIDQLHDIKLKDLVSPPWFISDTTSLLDQLDAFRDKREHFALVIDEFGSLLGIVTLEDILEEIVGDILDESDIAMVGVRPQKDGSFIINGTMTIRDLNRKMDWQLPDEEASTIAGLLLHETGTIPEVGQEFRFYHYEFQVVRRTRHQISAVRVKPPKPEVE